MVVVLSSIERPVGRPRELQGVRAVIRDEAAVVAVHGPGLALAVPHRLVPGLGVRLSLDGSNLESDSQRMLTAPSIALTTWQHSADTMHRRSDGEFLLHHLLLGVAQ